MTDKASINRTHLVPNGLNNTFQYRFPNASSNFVNAQMAVESISMYNSVFNVDSVYNNTNLAIIVPTDTTETTIDVRLKPAILTYSDISGLVQSALVSAGAYLIDNEGNQRHYFQLSENRIYYGAQVDLPLVPTSLPSGWTRPPTGLYSSTGTGLPTSSKTMRLSITNQGFGDLIGFSVGQYPSSSLSTAQSFLSTYAPTINPVSNFIVRCSMVNNKFGIPSDILTTFDSQGTKAGQLISYRPNENSWVKIADGGYTDMEITIVDQYQRPVNIRDPNTNIVLLFR